VAQILKSMQKDLLDRARAFRDANTFRVETYDEVKKKIEEPGRFFIAPWCQGQEREAEVKEETKATIRCLPLDDPYQMLPEAGRCMARGGSGHNVRAAFARSY